MDFSLFIQHRGSFLSKDLFIYKMEVSRNSLKITAKQRVEIEKDLNRGKRLIQKKEFHPENFIDELVSSYEDNSTSDEDLLKITKLDGYTKRGSGFRLKSQIRLL